MLTFTVYMLLQGLTNKLQVGSLDSCLDIMIEFYILQNIDLVSYQLDLVEYANDTLYEFMVEVNSSDSRESTK